MASSSRSPAARPSAGDDATRRAMDALRRIVRGLSASARGSSSRSSVSGAQRFVLRQIGAAPGLSLGELAARTLAGQSTVSEVVARLVERGLVSRRPGATDARQTTLTLTARGRRAIADDVPTAQERLASALGELRPARRRALADALETWLETAGLAELPPTMFLEATRPRSRRRVTS